MRNATVTTIAPTGTISLIAGVSSGIEPIFAREQVRTLLNKKVKIKHALLNEHSQQSFVTAHEIDPEQQVKVLAAFQRHTDNGVSKTVNLKSTATKHDIEKVFKLALELKCKGVTVYRDQSLTQQVCEVCK